MRKGYRDLLDPNDPYWPRVRMLHGYLWAKGTLATKNRWVVAVSFLWLFMTVFETIFSMAWRSVLLVGALFLIDWIAPGKVSCIFRETVSYEIALLGLSHCTIFEIPYFSLISLAALLVMTLAMIYPIREFLNQIFKIIFHSLNIILLGYPLKLVAFRLLWVPSLAGRLLEKSDIFGPVSTAMSTSFPPDYKHDIDQLWEVYLRTKFPEHEQELEDLLEELEDRYMR